MRPYEIERADEAYGFGIFASENYDVRPTARQGLIFSAKRNVLAGLIVTALYLAVVVAAGVVHLSDMNGQMLSLCLGIGAVYSILALHALHWELRYERTGYPNRFVKAWSNAVWPFLAFAPIAMTVAAAYFSGMPFSLRGWTAAIDPTCAANVTDISWIGTLIVAIIFTVGCGNILSHAADRNMHTLFRSGAWR